LKARKVGYQYLQKERATMMKSRDSVVSTDVETQSKRNFLLRTRKVTGRIQTKRRKCSLALLLFPPMSIKKRKRRKWLETPSNFLLRARKVKNEKDKV
jgi:hypothetical protein